MSRNNVIPPGAWCRPAARLLLAAMQRGHRHRLHRRHCCLFLGRSGLYPGGRALGCCLGGTLPSRHARRYSRSIFLSHYLLKLAALFPHPPQLRCRHWSLTARSGLLVPGTKTTVTRPTSIINPPPPRACPLAAASDSAGRVPRQRRPSPGLAWATRALRARARRARARMRVNGRDPPAATGPRGRVARAGLRL